MKVIILSCNTGEGHNTAGNAIIEGMRARGVEADMVNALELMGVKRSKLICGTYIKMVRKLPALFGFIYNLALLTSTHRFKSVLYYVNKPSQDKLYDYIVQNDYDTVVLPHLFPAETITSIRKNKAITNFKCYAIATDYTCIPFWEDLEMDGIVIGHKSQLGEMVDRGLDPKLLAPLGIPVSAKFAKSYDKAETRAKLGLGDAERIYLIMTGGMGFGNISAILTPLLSACGARDRVVVLGGRNEKLKASLRAKYESERKLQVVDFTTEVELYMAACDVLFTKPGGLSTSEAATMGVPLIHTKPIPGRGIAQRGVFFIAWDVDLRKERARDGAQSRRAGRRRGRQARDDPPPAREHQPQRRWRHLRLHHPLGAGIRKSFAPHNTRSSAQAEASHRRRAWISKDPRCTRPPKVRLHCKSKNKWVPQAASVPDERQVHPFSRFLGKTAQAGGAPRERSSACFPSV